jgi:hypothetical protein
MPSCGDDLFDTKVSIYAVNDTVHKLFGFVIDEY